MKNNILATVALIIAVIALAVSLIPVSTSVTGGAVTFRTTTNVTGNMTFGEPEWQCFAQECVRFVTGQEWVNQNCVLNETGDFNCAVIVNNQPIVVPLSAINVNTVSSCAETICTLEILTRAVNQ